jgi:UDP-N-acetylglucosamine--N-acetylmuramyl-(pentapeptide) pyrophosphoryl-undecaprenol N-acetylglucosamine transferase
LKLVLTGGGTGGHIYPALEVGRLASEQGVELLYLGSNRGKEGAECQLAGVDFQGFDSVPLAFMPSIKGLLSIVKLQQARGQARKVLRERRPDVVFSTGGYSSGPVVAAARDIGIPYVLHSIDSVPARSLTMFGKRAYAFTCVFNSTVELLKGQGCPVVRTGQPIRRELREAAARRVDRDPVVLVIGGSQGSAFLNKVVPEAAKKCGADIRFIHLCGPTHVEETQSRVDGLALGDRYQVIGYLDATAMMETYLKARVVVSRSGGTLAELAMYALPSVLVPLPTSANNHQLHNAEEFEAMQAATLLQQSVATPARVGNAIQSWMPDDEKRYQAKVSLQAWDQPDATYRILRLINEAAG